MLGNIDDRLKAKLLETYYDGDELKILVVDYLGGTARKTYLDCEENGIKVEERDLEVQFQIGSSLSTVGLIACLDPLLVGCEPSSPLPLSSKARTISTICCAISLLCDMTKRP